MVVIDQIGHTIELKKHPKRIVSLVPSQTELLHEFGLDTEVVGITKFCIHPKQWFKTKERVGGTKTLHMEKIKQLSPDLIIANKEENTKAQIEELQSMFPVWTSDISNLSESLEMINSLGEITNKISEAEQLIAKISSEFQKLSDIKTSKTALYLIWNNPYMSVGNNTFIHDMMERMNLINVTHSQERYPTLPIQQIQDLAPDLILLSSEPFPFKEKHRKEMENCCPQSKVVLVDGEMFSWYGSRLLKSANYFIDLHDKIS